MSENQTPETTAAIVDAEIVEPTPEVPAQPEETFPRLSELQTLKLKNAHLARAAAQRQIELCKKLHSEECAKIPEEVRLRLVSLEEEMGRQAEALKMTGIAYAKIQAEIQRDHGIDINNYAFDDETGICWKSDSDVPVEILNAVRSLQASQQ